MESVVLDEKPVHAVHRLDALRIAETVRINESSEAERRRVNEQMTLRADYDMKLKEAEAKRIDAIRAVDVAAVQTASAEARAQAVVLANQVTVSAETLRTLVAATAATMAQQLAQITAAINDRIAALEKSQYASTGAGGGMRETVGWIVSGFMLILAGAAFIIPLISKG